MPRRTLGPNPAESEGRFRAVADKEILDSVKQPEKGTLVGKKHSKNAMGDPSVGTARFRAQALERTGARFRIEPNVFSPRLPMAQATQANGKVIRSSQGIAYESKDWSPAVEDNFYDAPEIGYVHPPG